MRCWTFSAERLSSATRRALQKPHSPAPALALAAHPISSPSTLIQKKCHTLLIPKYLGSTTLLSFIYLRSLIVKHINTSHICGHLILSPDHCLFPKTYSTALRHNTIFTSLPIDSTFFSPDRRIQHSPSLTHSCIKGWILSHKKRQLL